ncbi:MAG: LysR family transcriptional regulator [Firmicutes bacterium]|nr:LysR family transcriptional regulator [Bacillota bacterium]
MELRVLKYFLMITRTENITKAADLLHITQPTLSRQIKELEDELGVRLFERDTRKLRLTPEGMLLKERAEEIVDLTDKTITDLKSSGEHLTGNIKIMTGLMNSTVLLSQMMSAFRKQYPGVLFSVYTSTADTTRYQLERGLIDFGVVLEPVDLSEMSFIRFEEPETWCAMMRADDPLAFKKAICPQDLFDRELVLPARGSVATELYGWLGKDPDDLNIAFTNTLGGTATRLVYDAHAISLSATGSVPFLDQTKIILRPLSPAINTKSALIWKRNVVQTEAAKKFIEFVSSIPGMEGAVAE